MDGVMQNLEDVFNKANIRRNLFLYDSSKLNHELVAEHCTRLADIILALAEL